MADDKSASTTQSRDKGVFVPAIFGGAVACALGFFGGQLDGVQSWLGWDDDGNELAALVEQQSVTLESQSETIAALEAKVAEVAAVEIPEVDLTPVTDELAAQSAALDEVTASVAEQAGALDEVNASVAEQAAAVTSGSEALGGLAQRLEEVEKRPMTDGVSDEAIAAYEAELERLSTTVSERQAAMQDELAAQQDAASATIAEQQSELTAAMETQKADMASTVSTQQAALAAAIVAQQTDMSATIDAQRSELEAAIDAQRAQIEEQRAQIEAILAAAKESESEAERQAQAALARAAMSDIITAVDSGEPFAEALANLEDTGAAEVPDALSAVAEEGTPTLAGLKEEFPPLARSALATVRSEGDSGSGVGGFLTKQFGVRSTVAREGDDPDAVLSRVEAAVQGGELDTALDEITALPDAAQSVLADWVAQVEARKAAKTATDELMSALSTN